MQLFASVVFFDGIRGVIVHLIEVFLIAMNDIYNVYGLFSCLPPGHLADFLATQLILALIINRRYYLDARTAFILIIYWHQDGDIN